MAKKPDTFGALVREAREAQGITLRKLCEQIGVSPTYLSQIEQSKFPPPTEEKIKLIAKLLKLDSDELMALADKVPSDLTSIMIDRHKEAGVFLRTAKDLPSDAWEKLQQQAERYKKEQK